MTGEVGVWLVRELRLAEEELALGGELGVRGLVSAMTQITANKTNSKLIKYGIQCRDGLP